MNRPNPKSPAPNNSTAPQHGWLVSTADLRLLDLETARQPLLDSTPSCTQTPDRKTRIIEVLSRPSSELSRMAMLRETVSGQAISRESSSVQKSSIAEVPARKIKTESTLEVFFVFELGTQQKIGSTRSPGSEASSRLHSRKTRIIVARDWQARAERARPMKNPNLDPNSANPEEYFGAGKDLLGYPDAAYNRREPSLERRFRKNRILNALLRHHQVPPIQ